MSSTSHLQIKTEEMRYDERNLIPSMEVDPCIMATRGKRVEVKKLGKLPQMLRVEKLTVTKQGAIVRALRAQIQNNKKDSDRL